jgi:hypothetical protein
MNITFCHNVYNRLNTLKDTISAEKNIYPDANISIAYNDRFVNIFQNITNFSAIHFNEREHKIGCVNGCILSIKEMLSKDFDVLIFSHDDVRINMNYIDVFKKHIEDITSGKYDIICRMPEEFGDNYYMMECFYLSKKAAIDIFTDLSPIKNENEISLDLHQRISPEVWLYNLFVKQGLKINEIRFPIKVRSVEESKLREYNLVLGQNLGYYHLNAGKRGWKE